MKNSVGEAEPFNHSLYAAPDEVVAQALKDLASGRRRSIFGFLIRIFALGAPLVPTSMKLRALGSRVSQKTQ